MQHIDEKVIERFPESDFEPVRAQIKKTIACARDYNNRPFDVSTDRHVVAQLATERLENIIARAVAGDLLIEPATFEGLDLEEKKHWATLSDLIGEVIGSSNPAVLPNQRVTEIMSRLQ